MREDIQRVTFPSAGSLTLSSKWRWCHTTEATRSRPSGCVNVSHEERKPPPRWAAGSVLCEVECRAVGRSLVALKRAERMASDPRQKGESAGKILSSRPRELKLELWQQLMHIMWISTAYKPLQEESELPPLPYKMNTHTHICALDRWLPVFPSAVLLVKQHTDLSVSFNSSTFCFPCLHRN